MLVCGRPREVIPNAGVRICERGVGDVCRMFI